MTVRSTIIGTDLASAPDQIVRVGERISPQHFHQIQHVLRRGRVPLHDFAGDGVSQLQHGGVQRLAVEVAQGQGQLRSRIAQQAQALQHARHA